MSQVIEPFRILAISAGNETLQKVLKHLESLLPSMLNYSLQEKRIKHRTYWPNTNEE